MAISEQIKILFVQANISIAELARKLGKSPQVFNTKNGNLHHRRIGNYHRRRLCNVFTFFWTIVRGYNMNHKKNDSQESNVLLFYGSNLDIGYIARTNTLGKEFDMVTRYIDDLKHKYSKFKTKKAAIFVEPQIDTGYPDIVVVEYYTLPQGNWVSTRESLNSVDYKILFYIHNIICNYCRFFNFINHCSSN